MQRKITLKLDDVDENTVIAQDGQNLNIDDIPQFRNDFAVGDMPLATPAF